MKKLFKVFSLMLVVIMAFPFSVMASENDQQRSDLIGAEERDFEKLIAEIQNIKATHPDYSEEMLMSFLEANHQDVERGIIDIWNALTDSEKKLCIRYPFDALKVNKAKNIATSQTEAKFGTNGLGNRSDAFRHGIWNAEMTVLIGKERAELFATAHEDKDVTGTESDGYPKTAHRDMDLHNNEVGREIGEKNKEASESEMADIIYQEIYSATTSFIWLRRMAAVYEQQLELCERHQQERELSMLQLRDIKHNMKNNLISILAYAENKEYEKMTGFIEEIMGEGGMVIASISNSGNIVIDSLIGYWYVTAQNKRIIFKTDICIPMIMPFKGADLSLILGNLLENAVEAAEKVEENRYINVKMKFDKNNLLLFVDNSYKGKLLKTRDNRLKSTKSDAENHGVGLASVYRAVAKYHGSVVIEDSEPGKFKIRIVLYSNVQE